MNGSRNVMTLDAVREVAPSVFAADKHESRSDKYERFPTVDIINLLGKERWLPVSAHEQNVRDDSRQGFQQHVIKFWHEKTVATYAGGSLKDIFELVLSNSNDGTSSYNMTAGIYRLVCSNGLVVGSTRYSVKVKHIGNSPRDVLNASMQIAQESGNVIKQVDRFKGINLEPAERQILAEGAMDIRFNNGGDLDADKDNAEAEAGAPVKTRFKAADLLIPRRKVDADAKDLWTTYNVIQENLIKGSRWQLSTNKGYKKMRAVNGIGQDLKLNKALWSLTEKMAELKKQ